MVRMSGSGSSLFTLCDAGDEAATMARQAREDASIDAIAVPIEPMLQMI
jgi:4-diphosphocytidyl-2C-methyl-D-erythritol kinase